MQRLLASLALVALAVGSWAAAAPALAAESPSTAPPPEDGIYYQPSIYFPGLESLDGAFEYTRRDGTKAYKILVTPSTLGEYIVVLYKFFTGATAIVALFMVTYGGFLWLVAGGNQGSISNAKEIISGAIAGMVIALLSYALLATISRGLVEFKSLNTRLEPQQRDVSCNPAQPQECEVPSESRPYYSNLTLPSREQFEGRYGSIFREAANDFGVDCTLLKAHALAESSGNPNARSGPGACGMLQVLPTTGSEIVAQYPSELETLPSGLVNPTCSDLQNPRVGIRLGAAYVAMLRGANGYQVSDSYCTRPSVNTRLKPQSSWSEQDKIAAYNGGPGANCESRTCPNETFWSCVRNPGYAETRGYVQVVQQYREMLIRDGRQCE